MLAENCNLDTHLTWDVLCVSTHSGNNTRICSGQYKREAVDLSSLDSLGHGASSASAACRVAVSQHSMRRRGTMVRRNSYLHFSSGANMFCVPLLKNNKFIAPVLTNVYPGMKYLLTH